MLTILLELHSVAFEAATSSDATVVRALSTVHHTHSKLTSTLDGGCRGNNALGNTQVIVSSPVDTCKYDSTFDFVADPAVGSVSLADYLAWAVVYQSANTGNGTGLQHWINVFKK